MDTNPEADIGDVQPRMSPASIDKAIPAPAPQDLFSLDDLMTCSGAHPEELSQSIVIMPDEHVSPPTETLYPQDLERKRSIEEFYDFVPYAFTRRAVKKPEDYPAERCVATLKMLSSPDTKHILKVQLEDLVLSLGERTLATLGPLLSSFRNLEVLILRNCGVESLERFVMPSLVYLDLTLNRINDLSSVCEFARNTLDIVHLDLTANPLLSRSQWKEEGWKLVAILTHLDSLNGAALTMEQHILANRKHGNVDDQRRLALRIYDEAFMKCAVASAAATHTAFSTIRWNPSSIIHLDLSKQQLQVFHVGPLVSLQTLNVSHNFLTRVTMGGLAACTALTTLDVSKNLLADHANVKYLSLLPSLNVLKLAGNPLADDKHIRLEVLQATSRSRGTPTVPGLQVLDRKPVTLAERLQAFQRYCVAGGARGREVATGLLRWKYVLISQYGQAAVAGVWGAQASSPPPDDREDALGGWTAAQLFAPPIHPAGTLTRLRSLVIQNTGLTIADVRGLESLEVLDLRNNLLEGAGVIGLHALKHLRVLDLAGNHALIYEQVLTSLRGAVPDFGVAAVPSNPAAAIPLANLESVTLGIRSSRNLSDTDVLDSSTLFRAVVNALVPTNRHLRLVEGVVLTPAVIAHAYGEALHWQPSQSTQYSVKLALLMAARPGVSFVSGASVVSSLPSTTLAVRSHHPNDVSPGVQYAPSEVADSVNLAGYGIASATMLDVSAFENVIALTLAHNRLTTLVCFGLERLSKLQKLDVHDNSVDMRLDELGAFISLFPELEMIALRENPCMEPFVAKRLELLSYIPKLRDSDCNLHVIDVPVTLEERVAAWRLAGGAQSDIDQLRAACALTVRTPASEDPATVETLDLENTNLHHVNLSAYLNLKHLSLRGNYISAETFLPGGDALGLTGLVRLETVDLRENDLQLSNPINLAAVVNVLSTLPRLRSIGLCGNWDDEDRALVDAQRVDAAGQTLALADITMPTSSPHRPVKSLVPHSLTREARLAVLSRYKPLASPSCALRLLDNIAITTSEIVDALYVGKPGLVDQREEFRAQLAVVRNLDGTEPVDCLTLDLSTNQLCRLNRHSIMQLMRLQSLDLSNNHLDDSALLKSGIDTLPLVQLNLSNNLVSLIDTVALMLQSIRSLKTASVAGNPCFPTDTPAFRIKLLSRVERSRWRGFAFGLNDVSVTAHEQVEGFRVCLLQERMPNYDSSASPFTSLTSEESARLYRLYFALVIDRMGVTGLESALDLSKQDIAYFGDLCWSTEWFRDLTTLNLSNNRITTLASQGLPHLPNLTELDLSENSLSSLEDVLCELEKCPKLTVLKLKNAVVGGSTSVPAQYTGRVFSRLQGLKSCDGVDNPMSLTAEQQVAIRVLGQIVGVHANALNYVDLSALNIAHSAYFKLMAPLSLLPLRGIDMRGNPCSDDIDGNETSHKLLTIAIHRKLRLVDGQEITEEDRVNAAAYFQSLPEEAQDQVRELPNWTPDTTSGEDIQLVQATFERKQATAYSLEKNKRIGVDVVLAELDELATVSRLSRPVSSRFGLVPTLQEVEEKMDVGASVPGPTVASPVDIIKLKSASSGPKDEIPPLPSPHVPSSADPTPLRPSVDLPQKSEPIPSPVAAENTRTVTVGEPKPPSVPISQPDLVSSGTRLSNGTFLHKLEIVVQFFQVYCIILWMADNNNLPWPAYWKSVKTGYDWPPVLLSVDVQTAYALRGVSIDGAFREYVRYGIIAASPILALLLFVLFSRTTLEQWVHACVNKWKLHVVATHLLLVVVCGGCLIAGIFSDYRTSWDDIGHGSTSVAQFVWIVTFVGTGVAYFLWLGLVLLFRRVYSRSVRRGGATLLEDAWASYHRNALRFFVFLAVILYFPAAHVILAAFSGRYDSRVLAAYGCQSRDGNGQWCCNRAAPFEGCFDSPDFDRPIALVWSSVALSIVVVVGVPVAFWVLIRRGVRQVLPSFADSYLQHCDAIRDLDAEIRALRSASGQSGRNIRATVAGLRLKRRTHLLARDALYPACLERASAPAQVYLMQGYTKRWAYTKLWMLCEKIALLCIPFYFPERWLDFVGYTVACVIIGVGFLVAVFFRPYADNFETTMDLSSRFTNCVNIGMCLFLYLYPNLSNVASLLILAIANGANAVILLTVLVVSSVLDFEWRATTGDQPAMNGQKDNLSEADKKQLVDAGVVRHPNAPLSPSTTAAVNQELADRSLTSPVMNAQAGLVKTPKAVSAV